MAKTHVYIPSDVAKPLKADAKTNDRSVSREATAVLRKHYGKRVK